MTESRTKSRSMALLCPANPEHGQLFEFSYAKNGETIRVLACIHSDHDGRPKAHPDGPSPSTRRSFTMDEIEGKVPV